MVLRTLAILGLGALLVSWMAEARSSHSLRRSPSSSLNGEDEQRRSNEEPHPRNHRYRHPLHHQTPPPKRGSSSDSGNSDEFVDMRTVSENSDYESVEDLWKEEDRQLPKQVLIDRLSFKGRETTHHRYPSHHRRYGKLHSLARENSAPDLNLIPDSSSRERELADTQWNYMRGKRHNRRRTWTPEDLKNFNDSRLKIAQFESESTYEVEVREAQNSSLCNYTVIPIPDPGGRIPHELEHIKCNHAGSRCQDKGTYCCIQTYRNIEVMYVSGKKEMMKVYSGCVCALQSYGTLEPYAPDVNIDD